MRRTLVLTFLLLATGVGLALPALAAEPVLTPMARLQSLGIDPTTFQPINLAPGGKMLLGFQQGSPEQVRKGAARTLWLLNLRSDGQLGDARRFDLNVPTLEQAAFTPDLSGAVVLTKSGATYLLVDFATGKVSTLMSHESGKPGFRADPTVLWLTGGKLLTTGYFYDAQDYAGENVVAEIDVTRTGVQAFREGPNIEQVERKLKGWEFTNYNNETVGFLGLKKGDQYNLYCWEPGKEPRVVDQAERFLALWGAARRLLYTARRPGGMAELTLFDADSGEKKILGKSKDPYQYLFLSSDGTTALASQLDDQAGKMTIFVAAEKSGFALKQVPGLKRVGTGMIRLAPDGGRMILVNNDGLRVVDLE